MCVCGVPPSANAVLFSSGTATRGRWRTDTKWTRPVYGCASVWVHGSMWVHGQLRVGGTRVDGRWALEC